MKPNLACSCSDTVLYQQTHIIYCAGMNNEGIEEEGRGGREGGGIEEQEDRVLH